MGMARSIVAITAGMTLTGVSAWNTIDEVWQPGQPSKQPSPRNPTPRPQNPQPGPQNPQPRPQNPQPDPQNPIPDPNSPGAPNEQPDRPGDQNDRQRNANGNRNLRPFAFQSPDMEGRLRLSTRRLVQMEQRMQRSQEDLLKRLGEARQLSGERQSTALFDVIQQLLKDQADMQRYLVQSRTTWTGDFDDADVDPEAPAVDEPAPNSGPER